MTKAKTVKKTTKAPSKKKKAPVSAANVGPIAGEIEEVLDEPVSQGSKKKTGKGGEKLAADLENKFGEIAKMLSDSNTGKKEPRQLRWALKSLDAAKDAAMRHVRHNV